MSLKEQVKTGIISARDALVEFLTLAVDPFGKKLTQAGLEKINTYRWLKKKAKENFSKTSKARDKEEIK